MAFNILVWKMDTKKKDIWGCVEDFIYSDYLFAIKLCVGPDEVKGVFSLCFSESSSHGQIYAVIFTDI